MFQIIVGTAALIVIWTAFKQWRVARQVRRSLAPGAGLTHGVKRALPRWLVFGGAFVSAFGVIAITVLLIQQHEKNQQQALIAQVHDKCIDAHIDKSKPFEPDMYLAAMEKCGD